jgi:hypothetical protein
MEKQMADNGLPHLVLDWSFNIPTQELSIELTEDLKYIALEGGRKGFTKIFKGETTHVSLPDWDNLEKRWISDNYGGLYGYFQPDGTRVIKHPTLDRDDHCPMGVGPDGYYLDHMQRRQCILDGQDQAIIERGNSGTMYTTIDNGKTIFKREAHRNVLYGELEDPAFDDFKWVDHSMPCLQQPWAEGVKVSSYTEMEKDGVSAGTVAKCKDGKWESAARPELQEFYTYPTE